MKIFKIEAGTFYIDGGAAFGVVPKIVWQKRYPCNDDNYCKVTMRCLLLETEGKLILIDTGTGDKQLEYLKYYGFEGVINFDTELEKLGYAATDVTDVVFTHLHFDHCGGATRYNADKSKVEMVFPNATHWVGEEQWQNFLEPNVREGDSYFRENMDVIFEAGKLKTVKNNTLICPGFEVRLFNGHTKGQLVSYIQLTDRRLVYCGDVIPLAANIPLAWVSSYDIFPLTSMEDKKKLLDEAVVENDVLFFEHDCYTECCTVVSNYKKHKIAEVYTLNEILNK